MTHPDHLVAFALEHPWALTPPMVALIAGLLADRYAGRQASPETLAAVALKRQALPQPSKGGGVALIPIHGVLAPRANMVTEMSGGATFQQLERQVQAAVADPAVKTIVFDVDSPGGNVAGATEFHRVLLKARAAKPCVAQAHYLLASAAYWGMSAATKIVASPSAQIGSIGVLAIYDDLTAALEQRGVKREVLARGAMKGEAIGGPLSADAKAHLDRLLDTAYARMTTDIANGRGVKVTAVRGWPGLCCSAEEAKDAGLVDDIATLDETLARLGVDLSAAEPLTAATAQEPLEATAQEQAAETSRPPALAADALWRAGLEAELLTLDL